VQEKLAEVVDGVGDQSGDAEVIGARDALRFGKVFEVDTGQVEKGVFVERGEFLLSLESGLLVY
jgi:hypothetical protein